MNARILVSAALLATMTSTAAAYPAKPVRFIVPFTPGGSQDVIARLVGQKVGERVGQQVVIDNRTGAAGLIAAELTARAAPDGYTIFMATAGPVTVAHSLQPKLAYQPNRDFAPVIHLVDTPMSLIVANNLPAKSVAELLAHAKSRAGQLNYASVGNGSISHLTMELFKQQTGLQLLHVPYKGAVPAFVDIASGQVQLMFITTAAAQPHLAAGRARLLAVAAKKRTPSFAQAPTLTEAGIAGLEVPVWAGVLTAASVPAPIIDTLYREMHAALQLPDVKQRLDQLGSEIVGDGPKPFAQLLAADFARWAKVIKSANLKLD
ncbi:MAG: tripartite tricarboxylate transporter substrate binding protein [Betaproteobacteria bacterium]|nr:tripartite tricarboxylate transporter substrate binding protein [Betaproteobacteria bacterium]